MDKTPPQATPQVGKTENLEEFLDRAIRDGGFELNKPRVGRTGGEIRYSRDNRLYLDVTRDYTYVTKNLFYDKEIVAYLNRDTHGMGVKPKGDRGKSKEYALFVKESKGLELYSEDKLEEAIKKFVSMAADLLGPEEEVGGTQ